MGEMSDWCGTACALQQHPAAHGMPARCAVGDGHLAALPAWLLYMAALLPSPCFPSPPHDMVVKKTARGRGRRGQPCASRKISTQMCAPHTLDAEWGFSTHTHAHMQLAGIPPSTPQHEEGVRRQTWRVCVEVGVGHWQACMAWWPWSAAQLLSMDSTCAKPREERVCVRERESASEQE